VRRILGLASGLPGLRRVDLATNHRCPPEVVRRAARLVSHNVERFEKAIGASPQAGGDLILAPDPGDDVARARRLLATWGRGVAGVGRPSPRAPTYAILARTNRELAPYAAVALERGIAHRIEETATLLLHDAVPRILDAARRHPSADRPLLAIHEVTLRLGAPAEVASALLAWAAGHPDVASLARAVDSAVAARATLRSDDATLSLATVHGTKGLEWDHVACVGFDEDRFPSARTLTEAADPRRALEEERRLAYVAWTRARRSLTIVYDPFAPSVFLREAFDAAELATGVVQQGGGVGAAAA
jgi:superfamily I DNA/RNA helicase